MSRRGKSLMMRVWSRCLVLEMTVLVRERMEGPRWGYRTAQFSREGSIEDT